MKKKNYNVIVKAYATVLVIGAESEEKALEYASDTLRMGDMQLDEAEIKNEVKNCNLESARRFADVVSEDE